MNTFRITTRRDAARRGAVLSALAVVAALSLTACGDDEAPSAAAQETSEKFEASGNQQPRVPGVSGRVAAVQDGVAQVQGTDGQVSVTLGHATVTTEQSASLDDVAKGSCVVVSFGTSGPEDEAADDTPATSVSISAPVDGECSPFGGGRGAGGPGGPGNGGPGGAGAGERPELPEGAQSPGDGERPEMPEGGQRPDGERPTSGRPGGGRVAGTVTAVSATGFTLEVASMPTPPNSSSEAPDSSEAPEAGDAADAKDEARTVVVDTTTTYSRTVTGTAKDVSEGRCVVATGKEDETGGLTAETVRVSDAVDGECTSGFGNGGGRR